MAKLISKVYGDALYAVAEEKEKLDEIHQESKCLVDILGKEKELVRLLDNPQIKREEKKSVMDQVFGNIFCEEFMNFIRLVIDKDRQSEFRAICEHYDACYKEKRRIGTVYVTSAAELSDSQKEKLCDKILATTEYESLDMHYRVDQTLIAGMRIQIKDRVVDSSFSTKFSNLTKNLRGIRL